LIERWVGSCAIKTKEYSKKKKFVKSFKIFI
jgi:hypothetical protein